jgi:hypothetical protein
MSNNILKVTFDASTINGVIVTDMNYSPSMSNPKLYSLFPNIFFIPSIKLKRDLFDKDLGDDDIKKIFMSSAQLDKFITMLREKKMYEPITIADAQQKGIIYNNIKFILDLFFKTGDSFFIYQTQYVINNYNWNNKYVMTPVPGKKTPNVEIKINFVLHEGNELSFIESTRLNCMQKKDSIVNDYYYLVGLDKPVGKTASFRERPTDEINKPVPNPPVKKTVTTTTTAYSGGKRTGNRRRTKKNRK